MHLLTSTIDTESQNNQLIIITNPLVVPDNISCIPFPFSCSLDKSSQKYNVVHLQNSVNYMAMLSSVAYENLQKKRKENITLVLLLVLSSLKLKNGMQNVE